MLDERKEEAFCTILREELQLATGCTEPIAVAYCAARLRQVLGQRPCRILAEVSGNILKNVKSVVVPNTGGRRDQEARLQVIAHVTEEDTAAIQAYLDSTDIRIDCPPTPRMLDIRLTGWTGDGHRAVVHVANNHTNIIYVERDGEVLLEKPHSDSAEDNLQDKSVLNVQDIITRRWTCPASRIPWAGSSNATPPSPGRACGGTGGPISAPPCCCPAATWRRRPGPGPPPGPTPG